MRILLVEDNRDILANLADYLDMKGYSVDCAQDGLSGLHLAATEHYDLIVLDVMLPGLDGYTRCRRLREDARRETPVIMLTARDQLDDRLQGFKAGADDYLIKPFALSELTARIEAVLRRAQGGGQFLQAADGILGRRSQGVHGAGLGHQPTLLARISEKRHRSLGVDENQMRITGQLHARQLGHISDALDWRQSRTTFKTGGKHFGKQFYPMLCGNPRGGQQRRFAQGLPTQQQG